jgi:hypothetical protein
MLSNNRILTSPKKRREVLTEAFGALPLVEAKRDIDILPSEQDCASCVSDPRGCALVLTMMRTVGAIGALFVATVAYVCLLDEKGIMVIRRFMIPAATSKFLRYVDAELKAGRVPKPPIGLLHLKAPTRCESLRGRAESKTRTRQRRKKMTGAQINAEVNKNRSKRKKYNYPDPYYVRIATARSAAGILQPVSALFTKQATQ